MLSAKLSSLSPEICVLGLTWLTGFARIRLPSISFTSLKAKTGDIIVAVGKSVLNMFTQGLGLIIQPTCFSLDTYRLPGKTQKCTVESLNEKSSQITFSWKNFKLFEEFLECLNWKRFTSTWPYFNKYTIWVFYRFLECVWKCSSLFKFLALVFIYFGLSSFVEKKKL